MRLTDKDKIKELSTLAKNEVIMTDSERKELNPPMKRYRTCVKRTRSEVLSRSVFDDD